MSGATNRSSAEALYAVNASGDIFHVDGPVLSWVDDVPTQPGLYAARHQLTGAADAIATVWTPFAAQAVAASRQPLMSALERAKPGACDLERATVLMRKLGGGFNEQEWVTTVATALAEARRAERERCAQSLEAAVLLWGVEGTRQNYCALTVQNQLKASASAIRALTPSPEGRS